MLNLVQIIHVSESIIKNFIINKFAHNLIKIDFQCTILMLRISETRRSQDYTGMGGLSNIKFDPMLIALFSFYKTK